MGGQTVVNGLMTLGFLMLDRIRGLKLNVLDIFHRQEKAMQQALVGDVIYVFGGRGSDGKMLADLYAFKVTCIPP